MSSQRNMTVHERPTGQRSGKGHGDSGKHGGSLGSSLGAKRANGKEILTTGEGAEQEFIYTAQTVHRAFSSHFNKHFGEGGWYRRSTAHPRFCMDQAGKDYREEVLEGAAGPSIPPGTSEARYRPFGRRRWTESYSHPASTLAL